MANTRPPLPLVKKHRFKKLQGRLPFFLLRKQFAKFFQTFFPEFLFLYWVWAKRECRDSGNRNPVSFIPKGA